MVVVVIVVLNFNVKCNRSIVQRHLIPRSWQPTKIKTHTHIFLLLSSIRLSMGLCLTILRRSAHSYNHNRLPYAQRIIKIVGILSAKRSAMPLIHIECEFLTFSISIRTFAHMWPNDVPHTRMPFGDYDAYYGRIECKFRICTENRFFFLLQ